MSRSKGLTYITYITYFLPPPLSGERFRQPVVAADGFTYENDELAAWVLRHGRISPITGEPISAVILPNRALSRQLGLPVGARPPCPKTARPPPESKAAPPAAAPGGGTVPPERVQQRRACELPTGRAAVRGGEASRDSPQSSARKCRSVSVPTMRAR